LVEADALAIVGEISAAVAHSIRNPLGSIRSSAELQRELGGDPDGTQTEIMRNVDRVETLVRSMLAYAADMPERGLHTDLSALVTDMAGRFAPDLGRQGKRLEIDLSPGLGRVAADPVLLAQILQSLLTNAAEATGDGGRVRVTGQRVGNDAVLEISDTGIGIEPGRMSSIFKPFHTSKPRGLGMGLALTHRVVKRLGGAVEIESRPQQGTTVRVRLPAQAA
jgi:two-component system, NtrC family, sensor histidine kinase HydH